MFCCTFRIVRLDREEREINEKERKEAEEEAKKKQDTEKIAWRSEPENRGIV